MVRTKGPWRRGSQGIPASIGAVIGATVLAACGAGTSQSVGVRASTPPTTMASQSSDWSNEGNRIQVGRQQANSTVPADVASARGPQLTPVETAPIDITSNGTYRLDAGPIPAGQIDAAHLKFGMYTPPDQTFQVMMQSAQAAQEADGTHIQLTVRITDVTSPYSGYRIWLA